MTKNNKAFIEAEKELQKDRINEIKNVMKSLLQKIQDEKEIKAKAEENLRLLKLDMDDLRAGKIEKIKERHDTSRRAKDISPIRDADINRFIGFSNSSNLANTGSYGYVGASGGTTLGNMNNMVLTSTGSGLLGAVNWQDATSGNFNVNCANGQIKEFNL